MRLQIYPQNEEFQIECMDDLVGLREIMALEYKTRRSPKGPSVVGKLIGEVR